MPIWFIIAIVILFFIIVFGIFSGVRAFLREYGEEKRHPVPAWDGVATQQLYLWRQEQKKEKERCPDCPGTRCWDWRRGGRGCGENPTLSDSVYDILTDGKHNKHTVKLVPAGWWPIPATRMGRINPHLWDRLLDHAPIQLRYQGALP